MRRRVQRLAMLLAAIATISSLGVSLWVSITEVRQLQQRQVEAEAAMLLTVVAERHAIGLTVDTKLLERLSSSVSRVSVRGPGVAVDYQTGADVQAFSATASDGKFTVKVRRDASQIQTAVIDALIGAAAVSIFVALLAWLMARYFVNRLQRVFDRFAATAREVGSGEARMRGRRYGMRELDEVAEVLDTTAAQLDQALVVERGLVDEISHQLRTPITALWLQLEEISQVADQPTEVHTAVRAAEAQLDRLSNAVADLVRARRGESDAGEQRPLAEVLKPVIAEIQPQLQAQGRKLDVQLSPAVATTASPGAVRHIVSILLENSVVHGLGSVELTADSGPDWVVLSVGDEGPGLTTAAAARLTGADREPNHNNHSQRTIGLPLARALASSQGGRLEWREEEPARLRLRLPSADQLAAEDELAIDEEPEDRP